MTICSILRLIVNVAQIPIIVVGFGCLIGLQGNYEHLSTFFEIAFYVMISIIIIDFIGNRVYARFKQQMDMIIENEIKG